MLDGGQKIRAHLVTETLDLTNVAKGMLKKRTQVGSYQWTLANGLKMINGL